MKDWCSVVPDRWKSYDMSGCCMLHDFDYEDQVGKVKADMAFLW